MARKWSTLASREMQTLATTVISLLPITEFLLEAERITLLKSVVCVLHSLRRLDEAYLGP